MENPKKIMIFTLGYSGHTNPILAFCKELQVNKNVKLIVYNQSKFKDLIEGSGAEYRHYDQTIVIKEEGNKNWQFNLMEHFYDHTKNADLDMNKLYQEITKKSSKTRFSYDIFIPVSINAETFMVHI